MTGGSTIAAEDRRRLAIIVPVLNEAPRLARTLGRLGSAVTDCVVVDGGSTDSTRSVAAACGARVIDATPGRASQMNAGAAVADPEADLLFLHADTLLPEGWREAIVAALDRGAPWGRFDVRMDVSLRSLRLVGALMNLRSRLTGICTGDQAMFVARGAWRTCGGFAPIPLMEDVELSRRLGRTAGRPACLRLQVVIDSRRWRTHGIGRTVALMWWLRWLYFVGVAPERLHALYYGRR